MDEALRMYKLLASPIVSGTSRALKAFELSPLDSEEREGGTLAIGALLYQYGAQIDARILCVLWVGGVVLGRAAEFGEKKLKEKNRVAINPNGEKVVTGQVVQMKKD